MERSVRNFKEKQKPIILIVDDLKEDWWLLNKKKEIIKERDELKEELFEYFRKEAY